MSNSSLLGRPAIFFINFFIVSSVFSKSTILLFISLISACIPSINFLNISLSLSLLSINAFCSELNVFIFSFTLSISPIAILNKLLSLASFSLFLLFIPLEDKSAILSNILFMQISKSLFFLSITTFIELIDSFISAILLFSDSICFSFLL